MELSNLCFSPADREFRQDWPVPDDFARDLSRRLVERIHQEIDANDGLVSFRRFMEMALYEPGLGYYSAGARKFGIDGDFTTAPEISPIFSRCIARQCAEILDVTGTDTILELGAGTGSMACEIIAELGGSGGLLREYRILETSADLRLRQQERLRERVPDFCSRVQWLDTLPETPVDGVMLANEVLDALPVYRTGVTGGHIQEVYVSGKGGKFNWRPGPAGSGISAQAGSVLSGQVRTLPDGYVTEFNASLPPFISSLSAALGTGAALFIDYGYPRREYYHPQRIDGTLLCYYRHRVHGDPFLYLGLQDITASVDFTLLAESANRAGLDLYGFTTQAGFLIGCGLEQIIGELAGDDEGRRLDYACQARQLVLPGQMGENIKVMALGRNIHTPLKGFRFADHRHRL